MKTPPVTHVFFLSDGTGITAETLGSTLLTQFPAHRFECTTVPFVSSVSQAEEVLRRADALVLAGEPPLIFSTAASREIQDLLSLCRAIVVDLMGSHLRVLGEKTSGELGRAHGVGNVGRYQTRMRATEYAMGHDDGQSIRALEKASLILIAPSRCGKTPLAMYLALQHGVMAANFPLTEEDFARQSLPAPLLPFVAKCFGLSSNPLRLSQIRTERRPQSRYASAPQCSYELREAELLYTAHSLPFINSATMSIEEMAALILQRPPAGAAPP